MKTRQRNKKSGEPESVTPGSDNVFADLGFAPRRAAELKVKAQLTLKIYQRIKALCLTQAKAARRLGISQPDVSKLMNGRHSGYTVDRLLALLNALDVDIDIVVRPRSHSPTIRPGQVRVMDATVA